MYLFIVIQSYYSDVGIWCQRWTFQRLNKALKVKEYNIVNENNSSLKLGWLRMIFAMLNTNSFNWWIVTYQYAQLWLRNVQKHTRIFKGTLGKVRWYIYTKELVFKINKARLKHLNIHIQEHGSLFQNWQMVLVFWKEYSLLVALNQRLTLPVKHKNSWLGCPILVKK